MAIIQKITNDNKEHFENAVEIWTNMAKIGNFIGIYDTRRNFYHERKGGCYSDDNHFRITNNLSSADEHLMDMDADSAVNYCINLGEQGGLENFRTICSIIWSNDNIAKYQLRRKGCADRGSENLAILLYLCGQKVISRFDLADQIMMYSETREYPHILFKKEGL